MSERRDLTKILALARRAAEEAGKTIVRMRAEEKIEIAFKGELDLVTAADLAAEKIIIQAIRNDYPQDTILSEEASPSLQTREDYLTPLWIIDPVDGTTNFAQGHYQVGISIAFAIEGRIQVGVVAAPFLNETFWAVRGEGAWLNGKKISVSRETTLKRSLIGTGFPYRRENLGPLVERVLRVLETCRDLRRAGAASLDLCWVGCGRLEGFYETLTPWDIAAGRLIAAEAGAEVGHIYGMPANSLLPEELRAENLVATCPGIFAALCEQLRVPGG